MCLPLGEGAPPVCSGPGRPPREGASFYSREKVPALRLGLRPRRGAVGECSRLLPRLAPRMGPGTGAPCPRPCGCHPSRPGLRGLHHRPPSFRACPGGQPSPGATWVAAGPELKYEGSRMRGPTSRLGLCTPVAQPLLPGTPPAHPGAWPPAASPPPQALSCPPLPPAGQGLPGPLRSQVPLPKCLSTLTGV